MGDEQPLDMYSNNSGEFTGVTCAARPRRRTSTLYNLLVCRVVQKQAELRLEVYRPNVNSVVVNGNRSDHVRKHGQVKRAGRITSVAKTTKT
jgi:hypothetical protein